MLIEKIVRVRESRFRDWLPADSIAQGNAYGTVVVRKQIREGFDLTEDTPIMCGHGGSGWLCQCCADNLVEHGYGPCPTHVAKAKVIVATMSSPRTYFTAVELQAFSDLGMPSPFEAIPK